MPNIRTSFVPTRDYISRVLMEVFGDGSSGTTAAAVAADAQKRRAGDSENPTLPATAAPNIS